MENRVHIEPAGLGAEERQTSAEGSGACARCPLEDGCGSSEVCRIMSASDEEIIAMSPDPEGEAAEMREILRAAIARAEGQS